MNNPPKKGPVDVTLTLFNEVCFMHHNYTCSVNHALLKLTGNRRQAAMGTFSSWARACTCAMCVLQLRSTIKHTVHRRQPAVETGSSHYTDHSPHPHSRDASCEWDRLPYGWRHRTSCITLGDMCPGDCPILTPPGLWQLCSVCVVALRSPSGRYFWVHTERKITVKRILWLAYLLPNSRNSFPEERLSSLFTGRSDKLEHILTISPCELPLLF
jgi:hypothetical protein